ncbi:MAG: SOS response-associated peptidase family protein [Croceibacterium sp.]
MCNLYRMTRTADEVARLFRADPLTVHANWVGELYPGLPGLVMAEGRVRTMTWGFPLVVKGKQGQPLKSKPVNNARTDKLAGPFWRASLAARRCLIPVTAYAEAEGLAGAKTRTWMTLPDAKAAPGGTFAVAGLWRPTVEWDEAYAMVIDEACVAVQGVHLRMPAIIPPHEWDAWLHGSAEEAVALCRPWSGAIDVERTDAPWVKRP